MGVAPSSSPAVLRYMCRLQVKLFEFQLRDEPFQFAPDFVNQSSKGTATTRVDSKSTPSATPFSSGG
jgi:hypothetical protein